MINIIPVYKEKIDLNGNNYFFIKSANKDYLLLDKCPHRGGPLSLGEQARPGMLKCPWHGNCYQITTLVKKSLTGIRIQDQVVILQ